MKNKKFIISIDGGGTKTVGALANFEGKILKRMEIGSSNPNKIGFEKAISSLKNLIFALSKGKLNKVKVAYLGLAGGLERDSEKREKIRKILQKSFPFKILVAGDQRIAFLAESSKKDGVLVIAGTGSISMGWNKEKEIISGGWDWLLGDQGSAFWIGKMALEKILKETDKREKVKTKLKNLILKKFKVEKEKDFYQKFYKEDFVEKVASISQLVDFCAKKGDKFSKEILGEASKELAKMAKSVIFQLKFQKREFPLVLVGGVFKSKIVFSNFKKEIKKFAPKAKIILSKREPVFGAIKLALEYACFRN